MFKEYGSSNAPNVVVTMANCDMCDRGRDRVSTKNVRLRSEA